ncbi:DNA-binding protein [Nocardioides seonyuensis]|uniref:DNA-binding protein n=1 Tax=Nocardioides seonyuensis TaxID=2518371 RepID=A0A4P7ID58_9ACTN|nr:helix-turn-helix domain-containing protein [Nocardioides seonyuensis]QBX55069.1 DNA-binding protein [Nocardioides seonyuensis]
MTAQNVAEVLGLKPKTLTNWRHLRQGPRPTYMGSRVAYRRVDVQQWIDDQAAGTAASEGWS